MKTIRIKSLSLGFMGHKQPEKRIPDNISFHVEGIERPFWKENPEWLSEDSALACCLEFPGHICRKLIGFYPDNRVEHLQPSKYENRGYFIHCKGKGGDNT